MERQGWPGKVFAKVRVKRSNPALVKIMLMGGMLLLVGWVIFMGRTLWAASEGSLGPEAPYKGVVVNKTKFTLAIPSDNSDATLIVPPGGWIEFTAWQREFNLTAYVGGKPFECKKIFAKPRSYQYMCTSYDFLAEIVKAEPVKKYKPIPKKRRIKKKPKHDEGVEAFG
jgi:hypothetical protein